jgi:methyl-accepting chemotaxis protein
MRLSLKVSLIGIVSILAVMLVAQSWIGLSSTQAIHTKSEDIALNWMPSVKALGEVKYIFTRLRLQGARAIMTSDQAQRSQVEAMTRTVRSELGEKLKIYEPLISGAEDAKLWRSVTDRWSAYADQQEKVLVLLNSGDTAAAIRSFNGEGLTIFNDVLKALDADIDLNNAGADKAKADSASTFTSARTLLIVLAAVAIAAALISAFIVIKRITSPLQSITAAMNEIANGELDAGIPHSGRRDEIGDMSQALQVFKENGLRVRRLEHEQKAEEARSAAERKSDMRKMADDFEGAISEIIQTVSSASTELEASASTLTASAARSQNVTTMVAASSEEASTNVQSVASATEEMASSVDEISRQVQDSARIAAEAVSQAEKTNDRIALLATAASRIGDVVELINTIAGQTNLLALNATIEAARAGDAGRGFAVVASEVKALAEQTAKATGDISEQISSMQLATDQSVSAIREIGSTIGKMSEIAATIASAVEEQGAATREISRNVQQAAEGTRHVNVNIADIQRGASETGTASAQVLSAAQSLAHESSILKDKVTTFLSTVRAA